MIGGRMSGCPTVVEIRHGFGRAIRANLLILVVATIAVSHVAPLYGQSGTTTVAVGGGLRLDVETRWPDGPGYRPVRITATPMAPPIADRTLVFEFTTRGYSRGRQDRIHVTQDIELPAGTGPVTTTLAVPYLAGHQMYEFRAGEDGREVRGLTGSGSFQDNSGFEASPRLILIGDQPVVCDSFRRVFLTQSSNAASGTFPTIAVNDLPSRWIDYSALDMIFVSFRDLQATATAQPEAFRAIVDWTAAGGNLLVFGVGANWERCESLQQLLRLPSSGPSSADSAWRFPDRNQFGQPVSGIGPEAVGPYDDISVQQQNIGGYGPYAQPNVSVRAESSDNKKPRPATPSKPPFISRPFEMGMLVAIATDKPFDEDPGFWAWLCNHLTSRRVVWYQRHGFSPHRDNPEFFEFLIQGVGKAPLNAFRILITLFVVVIGPVNYYLLRRFRRLHLLVVTVPVSAAGVTLALFAYAIFSDGLGTRVRVRSVTQINQQTGRTECWARLSYYSGMAPGDGLAFSDDVAVYPISGLSGDQAGITRDLVWYKGQKMESGWLRSRTPTQYLTVRSRKSEHGVDVGRKDDGCLALVNRLGTDVELLVVRDEAGKVYCVRQLDDGTQADAQPAVPAEAMADLLEAINVCKMEFPPGIDASSVRNRYGTPYYYNGNSPAPTPDTNLMEASFQAVTRTSVSPLSELKPRSYAAIVRFSPEVELGTPVARPEESVHLVLGSW